MYFVIGHVQIRDPGMCRRRTGQAILPHIVTAMDAAHGGDGEGAGQRHTGN